MISAIDMKTRTESQLIHRFAEPMAQILCHADKGRFWCNLTIDGDESEVFHTFAKGLGYKTFTIDCHVDGAEYLQVCWDGCCNSYEHGGEDY